MTVHQLVDNVESFNDLPQKEQIKLIAFFYCLENEKDNFETKDIKEEFIKQNLKVPAGITSLIPQLTRTRPIVFLKTKTGYTFHRNIKKELQKIYCEDVHQIDVSNKLRDLLKTVTSKEQNHFLEEAIKCFEIKAYRASIIMTWLLTMDVLYEMILESLNLINFNNAIQTHGKYKKIKIIKKDDFGEIKESDFIELLRVSKLISNDIRKILDEKLGIRNSCAHPNTINIEDYKTISFIQDLVNNVICKF